MHNFGESVLLEAVGVHNGQFFSRILSPEQLERLRVSFGSAADFSGNPERFFLAIEAHRIRFAHQFDPLLAVNVSQIDPLPHQIDAVYHHILQQPRIRFLLAGDPGAGKTIMTGLLLKELRTWGSSSGCSLWFRAT